MFASSAAEPETLRPMNTTAVSMGASCWFSMSQMRLGTLSSRLSFASSACSTRAMTQPTQKAMRNTVGTARTPILSERLKNAFHIVSGSQGRSSAPRHSDMDKPA